MPIPFYRTPVNTRTPVWVSEKTFGLSNFAGGLNNVSPDNLIADNELTDCKNMRFLGREVMESRPGTVISEYEIGLSAPVVWVDEYRPLIGEGKKIVATSTAVYVDGEKLLDVQGNIRGVNYIGKYYFVDGKNFYVYDGETYYKILSEPVAYLAEDTTTTTTEYKFKRLPEQIKVGDVFYALPAVNGTDNVISKKITAIDTENKTITVDATVGKKMLKDSPIMFYTPLDKTNIQGEEIKDEENHLIYYNPCINELSDTYAGASYFPDSPNLITVHKDRLFVAGDSEQPHGVYMTATNQPLYFPSNAGVAVKPNGKPIVDMVVFDDALIIARNEDMYVLYGDSEYSSLSASLDPFRIKQMDVSTGFMGTDCGALLNNFYIYLGYDGRFYKLNTPTTYVEYLMTRPVEFKCDIYSPPFNIDKNTVIETSTVAYRNEIYYGIGENLVIVYNYDNMAFTYYVGWQNKCLFTDGQTLYIGRTDGKITKWDDVGKSYTDLGDVMDCKLYTKRFDCGDSIGFKYFKHFVVTCQAYSDESSEIHMAIEMDFFENPMNDVINANIAKFGQSYWGKVNFNNKNLYKTPYYPLDVRGRTIKYKFSNNTLNIDGEGQPFRIYNVDTVYSSRDVR